jgi:hypothetical protein
MQSDDELVFLYNLIGKMIQKELKERMALPDVIKKLVAILPGKSIFLKILIKFAFNQFIY